MCPGMEFPKFLSNVLGCSRAGHLSHAYVCIHILHSNKVTDNSMLTKVLFIQQHRQYVFAVSDFLVKNYREKFV